MEEKIKLYNVLESRIDHWTDSLRFYRFTNNARMFHITEENIQECMEMRFDLYRGGVEIA